jgi:hypothetical protein
MSPMEVEGHEMSSFAVAVQAILVTAVIGLAVRSWLKREKELLFAQLREKAEGRNPELVAMQAKQEIAEGPEIETASLPCNSRVAPSANGLWTFAIQNTSCPDCGCTEFEMKTYGGPWEYADTHCAGCGKLIRRFDAA